MSKKIGQKDLKKKPSHTRINKQTIIKKFKKSPSDFFQREGEHVTASLWSTNVSPLAVGLSAHRTAGVEGMIQFSRP